MDGVDVIALDNIADDPHHKFPRLFVGRIEILGIAIGQKPFGMSPGYVVGCNRGITDAEIGPVWIAPGMKLHSSLMRLLNHELQRVIIRRGSLSLPARQPLAPRLVG